jgi:osmoprotectant transport system substrate-binding protein
MITLVAVGLSLSLVAGACGSNDDNKKSSSTTAAAAKCKAVGTTAVTIGAQDFGESAILAEVYAQGLRCAGFDASVKKLGANAYRPVEMDAFKQKTINFAPEYAASMLEFVNNKKGEATGDAVATTDKLKTYLPALGLTAQKPSDAVDTNAFVVTKKTSDDLGIKTLSDLAAKGKSLKLGAPSDCATNPFCIKGLKNTYGLDLSNYTSLGAGQPIAQALEADTIQIGILFSTASTIAVKGFVLLDDDKHMLAADNVVPVMTTELGGAAGFADAVNKITATLTTQKLIDMNKRYDVDKEDAAVIAKDFLTTEKLL